MDDLEKLMDQDKKARLKALDPMRSFIVQAPAGSGKTELLTQRYLKLLSRIDKGPEEIIAVTFTRKAAAEMRSRVVNALMEAKTQNEAPNKPHAQLTWTLAKAALKQCDQKKWDWIAYPNQLRILTIDALCSHLAARMPILSNFGAAPEVTTHPNVLYQKAVSSLLTYFETPSPDQGAFKTLLRQLDNRLELAESLMITMLSKRDQWLVHMGHLKRHESSLIDVLQEGLQRIILDKLTACYEAFKQINRDEFFSLIHYLANNLLDTDPNHPLCALLAYSTFPKPSLEALPLWVAIYNLLMTQTGDFRKTYTITHGFLPPSKARDSKERALRAEYKAYMEALIENMGKLSVLKVALKGLENLPPSTLMPEQASLIQALLALLPLLTAHLTLQFKECGKVDFIEVALRAIAALGHEEAPTDLALSIDYQLKHLLIDEFQDTSFSQFYLFEKLVAGWTMDEGRTLFLVGDPMQSIYRFRGAEVGLFLHVQYHGLNQITLEPLRLTQNFRSEKGIVQWVNATFCHIFPKVEDRQLGAVVYAPAIAHTKDTTKASVFFYPQKDDYSEYCLELIMQLLKRYPGDSMAILVRARRHLETLLPLLRRLHIPFEAHDIEHLGLKQPILDLLSLTQALLDLSDKVAWLAILRAPWCGLTLADLYEIARHPNEPILWPILLNYEHLSISQDGKHRLARILPVIQYWLMHRQRHSLSAFIKGIWFMLGGPACYSGGHILSQTAVFFELLDKQGMGGDLIDRALLENTLSTLFAPGYIFSPSDKGTVIQLMTIHKSKGLEFDIVIVPALEKLGRINPSELLIWYERKHTKGVDLIIAPRKAQHHVADSLYQHVNAQLSEKSELENARLLYVAVTRARKQIHLWGEVGEKPPAAGSFLAYLWPGIQSQTVFRELPEIQRPSIVSFELPLTRLPSDWPLPKKIGELSQTLTTPSHPLNQAEHRYQVDKLIGIFTHKIFQFIGEQGLAYWDKLELLTCVPAWRQGLTRLGVRSEDLQKAVNSVIRAISNTLKSPMGRYIFDKAHTGVYNEWALQYPTLKGSKKIIIDRAFIDSQGLRWIVDYKLGEEALDYYDQLSLYAKIVSQLENRDINKIRCALYFPLKPAKEAWKEIRVW